MVDNASADNSLQLIAPFQPKFAMRVIPSPKNVGFAAANNLAAQLARGDWLATLNPDAFPKPNWLASLVAASQSNPGCFFASRLIQAEQPTLLDGEGDAYHISGLAWRRHYGSFADQPKFTSQEPIAQEEVFGPCAAAALYPRTAFLEVAGFDEDFYAYHEDVDLGFRLRLRGWRCMHIPSAVVYHHGAASTGKGSDFVVYHGHRNLVWSYAKNMPLTLLLLFLPLHIAMNMYFLVFFSLKGRGAVIWKAKRDALAGIGQALKKRKAIHQNRAISLVALLSAMEIGFSSLLKARAVR